MKIYDCHVHVGSWPEFDLSFTLKDLEDIMMQYGYSGAVVMPALVGDPLQANQKLLDEVRRIPRYYFFAWIHPHEYLLEFLERNKADIFGLKYHASISGTPIDDPELASFLEFANHNELPLLYHCGRTPISWGEPVKAIANSYPHVKFILAHMGGNAYDRIIKTMELFRDMPENIYVDSSTARHPDLLARVIKHYGRGGVMYGTDLPFTDMRLNWDCLRYAGIDKDFDFLGGNLRRLLKLS